MWQFYKEPFDVSKPPPAPPNRDIFKSPRLGGSETKQSITRTTEYMLQKMAAENNEQPKVKRVYYCPKCRVPIESSVPIEFCQCGQRMRTSLDDLKQTCGNMLKDLAGLDNFRRE